MYSWLILALVFAALEAIAVSRNVEKLEYVAKPAVMACLFLWLYMSTGLHGHPFWFGVGVLFSLAGDVLLMISLDKMFLLGLVAFLIAHLAYINGFQEELTAASAWSLIPLLFIAIAASRLLRWITEAMRTKGESRLIIPVMVYGTVVSVMLYAGISTFYDPTWKFSSALLAGLGAFLFWLSDLILAWNKFVSPIKNGRGWNIALYHLGQIGLIAGVISRFG